MTRREQRQKHAQLREAAKAICHAATGICVAALNPERPPCDDRNCRAFPIARAAIKQMRALDDPH